MTQQISTRTAKITCLCGAVTEPGSTLVAGTFPISTAVCSCSICRQSSGTLGISPTPLTGPPSSKSLAACKVYTASDRAERYFCSTCGAHVFIRHCENDKWWTLAGVIDRDDDATDIDTHKVNKIGFLSETRDGGFAARMRSVALESSGTFGDVKCYAQMPLPGTDVPLIEAEKLWQVSTPAKEQMSEKFLCACHCGKVQFYVIRPDAARNNLANLTRVLRANNTKYVAKLCVCRYCRLAASTPFMPWTYVMPENILTPNNEGVILGFNTKLDNLPGAQVYYSSGDSKRSFCDTCGATLFYECEDRPQIVDISVGLFRSESGVLAEDILEWNWPWVSWKDSGRDNQFLKSLTIE